MTAAVVDAASPAPKKTLLPRGRQPAAYDDAALSGYLQAQWDAHHRLPTYAELQRGDPDNPEVPRFGGSLTRLVRLRRAFLAKVDPTSAAASQHRLSRVEKAVEKNTGRTDHAIEVIERAQLDKAVRDLVELGESLRVHINKRDLRTQSLSDEVYGLREELQSLSRAFKQWSPPSADTRKTKGVAVSGVATRAAGEGEAELGGELKEVLTALLNGQSELSTRVGSVVDTQTQLGQAIGDVQAVASERHHALDVVAGRLEAAVHEMKTGPEARPTEDQLKPLSEMAARLESAAKGCLRERRETMKEAGAAGAEAGKSAVEAHSAATETGRTQLLASIDGRLQSIEQAFADALAIGADAHDQAAGVAREVTAKACVELGKAANAQRESTQRAEDANLGQRMSAIEKGISTLLRRRSPRSVRLNDESLGAIEALVERRCARIVKRIAAAAPRQASGLKPRARAGAANGKTASVSRRSAQRAERGTTKIKSRKQLLRKGGPR